MKALILNSGIGKRMGDLTKNTNKCMAPIDGETTIIDRQLTLLQRQGIKKVLITTGPFRQQLEAYVTSRYPQLEFEFVYNERYESTNYIFSIYLAKELLQEDIVLMHGDLVFAEDVLHDVLESKESVMVVDSTLPLPDKDFKAVVENGKISKVGIEFFDNALEAQALYKLQKEDWMIWLDEICRFCEIDNDTVYAENALNEVSERMNLYPLDVQGRLCAEVDNPEDLQTVKKRLN